jgi:hypothetical protein
VIANQVERNITIKLPTYFSYYRITQTQRTSSTWKRFGGFF